MEALGEGLELWRQHQPSYAYEKEIWWILTFMMISAEIETVLSIGLFLLPLLVAVFCESDRASPEEDRKWEAFIVQR